jgi:WD40 repeat protein
VRFLREARVTGLLEHPNVVPVYELGVRADGTLYYTMRLVHGRTMAQALKACQGLRDRLKLLSHFADVCHAVAYAHSRGVIHRDLKAENVMLGEFGETVVLDWGLAKVAGQSDIRERDLKRDGELLQAAAAGLTVEGSLLGTPDHMSPEQARGTLEEIDERSDVWALGTVLYEILTGRRPFIAPSPLEVIRKVLHEQAAPPRQIEPAVPSELESVCLKALAKEKASRYATAGELAREIESYQSGEKVVAHEYSAWEHLRRFATKKRPVIVAAAVVALVTVGALVGVTRALAREKVARGREAEQRLLANYHLSEAFHEKAVRLGRSGAYLSAGVYAAASLLHNPANPLAPEHRADFEPAHPEAGKLAVEAASWAWVSGVRATLTHERTIVAGQSVCGVAISRDGLLLAGAACDSGAWVWDAATGATLLTVPGGPGGTTAVAFAPDGATLATATEGGDVKLWSLADGRLQQTLHGHTASAADVAFSWDGKVVASASRDGTVILWNAANGARLRTLAERGGVVHSLAFAVPAEVLATGSRDAAVRLWNPKTGRLLRTLTGHAGVVRGVALSPDGRRVASASYDRTAKVWDTLDGRLLFTAQDFEDEVLSTAFSSDGKLLAVGSWDRSVGLYDAATGKLLQRLEGHTAAVWDLAFAASGSFLASASDDGTVRLWALRRPAPGLCAPGQGYIWSSSFSPDGHTVAIGSADRALRLWDTATGTLLDTFVGHGDTVADVAFSPDGTLVASASFDSTVRIWDAASGTLRRVLSGHGNFVRSVAFSPDGRVLASGSYDRTVILWDTATGRRLATLSGHAARVRRVAFSPDGNLLASGGDEPVIYLWNPHTSAKIGEVRSDGEPFTGFAFSHGGGLLATAGAKGTARVWELKAARWRSSFSWDEQALNTVTFSADDRLLLAAGDDRRVVFWSLADARARLVLETAQSVVTVQVSPDGRTVVVGDGETARMYPVDPDAVLGAPAALLQRASVAAGLALDGFNLVPPQGRPRQRP